MPKAPAKPCARPASSSMWMGTNSSFTAAYRFQLWNPVVRTKVGSSVPTVTDSRSTAISVPDQRVARGLDRLAPLVRPGVLAGREEHESQASFPLRVLGEPGDRCD